MKLAKNCRGKTEDTTVYSLFTDDYKNVFDIELTEAQAKKLALRKGNELVAWIEVHRHSNQRALTGCFATEALSAKDIING